MNPVTIHVENLVKRYGNLVALDHLNLDIEEGEIFGLLGPNGSGKTTAINCMLSLLTFDKGMVTLFGEQMSPSAYAIKNRIGVVPQHVAVFEELSVRENISYFCSLYIKDRKLCDAYTEEAIDFVGLAEFARFRPKKLSGGLLRRLNIACGIVHKPRLLFLDEPTVAVDPQSRNNILEGIRRLNKEGTTVVYTSHYMEEVEQLCQRIAIMDKGRVIALGTKEELKSMLPVGETITIQMLDLPAEALSFIRNMEVVLFAKYEGEHLKIKCTHGKHNLARILKYLEEQDLHFGEVYSELPTLNDVFLEITGKELRDQQ